MIRFFDILLSALGLIVGVPLLMVIFIACWIDTRSPLFRQERVGRYKKPFILVKFRTMRIGTASVASHLVDAATVTKIGRLLRRLKLDELPQLWNVLKGDMSLVGPRPCLFSQHELIRERDLRSVFSFRPGITGLAQIHGVDMSTPQLLAQKDAQMLEELDLVSYLTFIIQTAMGAGRGDRIIG